MDRNELIEAMARAIHETMTGQAIFEYLDNPFDASAIASATLTAIEAQGLAIVPVEATDGQSNVGGLQMIKADNAAGIYRAMIEAGKV